MNLAITETRSAERTGSGHKQYFKGVFSGGVGTGNTTEKWETCPEVVVTPTESAAAATYHYDATNKYITFTNYNNNTTIYFTVDGTAV